MPSFPLQDKSHTKNADFYKQTDIEPTYGGATAFLRGLYQSNNLFKNEMFHVHMPSLKLFSKNPITFKRDSNGNYIIIISKIPYANNGMKNVFSNWCINVEINNTKYKLFAKGALNYLVNSRLLIRNITTNINVNLNEFQQFIINFQD